MVQRGVAFRVALLLSTAGLALGKRGVQEPRDAKSRREANFQTIDRIRYEVDEHLRNAPEKERMSTVVEDLHKITSHLDRLDDIVNEHGETIREEILRVMVRVTDHETKLKERVQRAYVTFQARLDKIDTQTRRLMDEHSQASMTEFQKFQEMAEDLMDDWQSYVLVLVIFVVVFVGGFLAYFSYLRSTVVLERKRV